MKTYFSGTQKSSIWGVWAAPGAPESPPKDRALRAPPFGVVYEAPGSVQTPKIDDFCVPEKYIFMMIFMRSWGYEVERGTMREVLGRTTGCYQVRRGTTTYYEAEYYDVSRRTATSIVYCVLLLHTVYCTLYTE